MIQINETEQQHFLQEAEKLGFTAWQPIEAGVFEDDLAFNPYRKSAYTQRTWEARVQMVQQQTTPRPKKQKPEVNLNPVLPRPTPKPESGAPRSHELNGDKLLNIRNFGEKSLIELVDKLKAKGYLSPDDELNLRRN